jgi:2-dehydro-3-deoxyglucarate aldolase/4-hydroxy-2-oxoheptanedioate aldolase
MKNDLKKRLHAGQSVMGTMITIFDNLQIAKIVKLCGFDFFIIDCEHGSYDYSAVANILAMAREVGIPAIVRIPSVGREAVLKYLEMGAAGLLLPSTETAEQARLLVQYAKYAPLGDRGVSLFRPHAGYEKVENAGEYMQRVNQEMLLVAQIESRHAVQNCEAILAVEGIDAAFIGPSDLSQSLGIFGQLGHPDFISAVDRVIAAAKHHGKYSGLHCMTNTEALEPWIKKGMTINLWANEAMLMINAAREGLARFKQENR